MVELASTLLLLFPMSKLPGIHGRMFLNRQRFMISENPYFLPKEISKFVLYHVPLRLRIEQPLKDWLKGDDWFTRIGQVVSVQLGFMIE